MATRIISTRLAVDGEAEFKKQMTAVNGELRNLKTEMQLVDAEFKGQANSLDYLTKKDRILRDEMAQQEEKVRALEAALEDATKAYGEADSRTDKYRQQLNQAKAALTNLNREVEDNTKYMGEAEKSHKKTAKSIDEYGKAVETTPKLGAAFKEYLKEVAVRSGAAFTVEGIKKFVSSVKDLPVDVLKKFAGELSNVAQELYSVTTNAAAYADGILTDATNTGLSTEALQEYKYMAELTDVSYETITKSHAKLIKNMATAAKGTGDAAAAFKALGVSVTDSNGELRNNQEVFAEVIDALGTMDNATQRDAYSMQIFGKSAQDLNSLIAAGSDGVAAFAQEARDMGAVLDEDTLAALGGVDDAVQRFSLAIDSVKNQIGAEFAPAIEDILTGTTALISGNVDEGVDLIMSGLDKASETLDRLGPVAEAALEKFIDTVVDNLPEITETGAELIVKLVVGLTGALPKLVPAALEAIFTLIETLLSPDNLQAFKDAGVSLMTALWEGIKSIFSRIGTWISNGVKSLARSAASSASDSGADGSHAGGLSYVPYDGYRAILHEGETVLTAREASTLRSLLSSPMALRQSVSSNDIQQIVSEAVNAMAMLPTANGGESLHLTIQTRSGIEIARAFVPDIRKAMRESPEVANG